MSERTMPTYCYEGQVVYVKQGDDWIKTKVTLSCGVVGRVENQIRGISGWRYLHEMRIDKPTTIVDGSG